VHARRTVSSVLGCAFLAIGLTVSLTGCGLMDELTAAEPTSAENAPAASPTPKPTTSPFPIIDGGAQDMANGTATTNPDGTVTYIVADGDVGGVICDRFGLAWAQLQYEDLRGGINCYAFVYPGDVLNLSSARNGIEPT